MKTKMHMKWKLRCPDEAALSAVEVLGGRDCIQVLCARISWIRGGSARIEPQGFLNLIGLKA